MLRLRGFEMHGAMLLAAVDGAGRDRPGIDDFRDRAAEQRLRRHAAQRRDQAGDERADGGELEPHIAFVGEAGIGRDLDIDLFAPGADLFGVIG